MKFFVAAAAVSAVLAADDKTPAKEVEGSCKDGIAISVFTDDKCKTPAQDANKKAVVVKPDAAALKVINDKCNELDADEIAKMQEDTTGFKALAVTCDTKAMTSTLFKKADCTGEAADKKATAFKWDECTEVKLPDDKKIYYKITGAAAIQATAAAALAFVATQF